MTHQLFFEIDKFDKWAQDYSDIPQDDIGGEWECGYDDWQEIYKQFDFFIKTFPLNNWTSEIKNRLLYIIARDNEMEVLVENLPDAMLVELAKYSILNGKRDDKWQLAVQLSRLSEKSRAIELLDKFVNDKDEYVNRRSLLELAKLDKAKTEYYCKKFWDKNIYEDMEEFQRIAILHSLKTIQSPLLTDYLLKAKMDGRKHLVKNAEEIEDEIKNAH
jgi:hypothetical protein